VKSLQETLAFGNSRKNKEALLAPAYDPLVDIDLPGFRPDPLYFKSTHWALDCHWTVFAGMGVSTKVIHCPNPRFALQICQYFSHRLVEAPLQRIEVGYFDGHGPMSQIVWLWYGGAGAWKFTIPERQFASSLAWEVPAEPCGIRQREWSAILSLAELALEAWHAEQRLRWFCFHTTSIGGRSVTKSERADSLESAMIIINRWKSSVVIDRSTSLSIHNPDGQVCYRVNGTNDWEWVESFRKE
jgi:hypothetical protein